MKIHFLFLSFASAFAQCLAAFALWLVCCKRVDAKYVNEKGSMVDVYFTHVSNDSDYVCACVCCVLSVVSNVCTRVVLKLAKRYV